MQFRPTVKELWLIILKQTDISGDRQFVIVESATSLMKTNMMCDVCKKYSESCVKKLLYYFNREPIYRITCSDCERDHWMEIKSIIMDDRII